jgi:hypothetical protein
MRLGFMISHNYEIAAAFVLGSAVCLVFAIVGIRTGVVTTPAKQGFSAVPISIERDNDPWLFWFCTHLWFAGATVFLFFGLQEIGVVQ